MLWHRSIVPAMVIAAVFSLAACDTPLPREPMGTTTGGLGGPQGALAPEAAPQGALIGGSMGAGSEYLYDEFDEDEIPD